MLHGAFLWLIFKDFAKFFRRFYRKQVAQKFFFSLCINLPAGM
jgi:hypothetical protein